MTTQAQLRIATRIHYALKHHLGEGIDVAAMLGSPAEAREVLFVCQASGDRELMALAHQFVVAGQLAALGRAPAAPQEAAWGSHTSGFGVSQAAELAGGERQARKGWWPRPAWLRRDDPRR